MFDYEWATVQHHVNCRLARTVVVPDAIPPERLHRYGADGKIHAYEGLKEEYYLSDFEPDPACSRSWGSTPRSRSRSCAPPPEVSLYHRFENDLFAQVLDSSAAPRPWCCARTAEQRGQLLQAGGFVVPERAIDAQSLIAYADLVVSAGGTMNREAVALGTPVLTVFEGRLGAVDERLIAEGRLGQLRSADQLELVERHGADDDGDARVRRDPAILTSLLLTAARPARKGRRQVRSGRVSP